MKVRCVVLMTDIRNYTSSKEEESIFLTLKPKKNVELSPCVRAMEEYHAKCIK